MKVEITHFTESVCARTQPLHVYKLFLTNSEPSWHSIYPLMFPILIFVLLPIYIHCFYFLVITALLFNVYYNCVILKCTMNLLTLAISSNGSHVISMLNLCTQIILSQSCLSKNFYHQCKIILFQRCINFTIHVS